MKSFRIFGALLIALGCNGQAWSQADDVHVPAELQDWVPWVLHGDEFRNCPFFSNREPESPDDFICAWPGRLTLDVNRAGGQFSQRWQVYEDSWIVLPGDTNHWPQNVTAGGDQVTVTTRGGRPAVELTTGRYTISGRFLWQRQPPSLPVSASTGLVQLNVDGNRVEFPEWENGSLWLGERRQQVQVEDRIEITVFRRISDGVPLQLETLVRVNVSGRSREERLGVALPSSFVPLSLSSQLPARVEPDGTLLAQVRPGRWEISVRARDTGNLDSLEMNAVDAPWPAEEIWSYQGNNRLRVTTPEGGEVVDPIQTEVPSSWRSLPAFRMQPGESLTILERSRGLADQDSNQLTLQRQLWVDFDGGGITARDSIGGSMRRGWRLDTTAPFDLKSARANGENLLVTRSPDGGGTGIELRAPMVSVDAISRVEETGAIPATGWQQRFNNVQTHLNLPPGFYLLGATGADAARGAWYDQWVLWDVFLILLIAAAIGRMFHPVLGVLSFVMLTVTYHEPGAPIWSWLNLLVAVVLADAAPVGRLKKIATNYRNLSYGLIVLLFLPFAANQVRMSLFPQLENSPIVVDISGLADMQYAAGRDEAGEPNAVAFDNEMRMSRNAAVDQPASSKSIVTYGFESNEMTPELQRELGDRADDALLSVQGERGRSAGGGIVAAARPPPPRPVEKYAPGALLQTGPGIPNWNWNRYYLTWKGPVEPEQEVRLFILKPWATAIWRVSGVVLILLLLLAFSRTCFGVPSRLPLPGAQFKSLMPAILLALVLVPWSDSALGQTPDFEVLQTLRQRLIEPPECAPQCAEIVNARVAATTDRLTMNLEVHVADHSAIAVPGSDKGFKPDVIFIDGATVNVMYRDRNDVSWIDLSPGIRQVRLTGALPPVETVQVVFPQKPHQISAGGRAWEFAGISNGNLTTNTLELIRVRTATGAAESVSMASERFPVFVRVIRQLALNVEWTVTTVVNRVSPQRGAFTVEIPLLQNESVVTENREIVDGNVIVAMAGNENQVSWQSVIPVRETVELDAPDSDSWSEVWTLTASPMWRVTHEGVPVVTPRQINPTHWVPEFYPNPGEQLILIVSRPEASEGRVIAFDSVSLETDVGKRSQESSLQLQYRATRGGQHRLVLPDNAEVLDVMNDGQPIPVRPTGRDLEMPISPGQHIFTVRWRKDTGVNGVQSTPEVDLGMPSGNVSIALTLPQDRWVLFATGPRLGPAVLYWAELVVFIVIAVFLGRTRHTPLRTHHWLILGLGLSTFSWFVLLTFTVWLFVMSWWQRQEPELKAQQFNFVQVLLGVFSVAAILSLISAIPDGLLGTPDMRIEAYRYGAGLLSWFADKADSMLPQGTVISVPLIYYKAAMLLWALWLSFALVKWLPWAWKCYTTHGLWKGKVAT